MTESENKFDVMFVITHKDCHPEFGDIETIQYQYKLFNFLDAYEKYKTLKNIDIANRGYSHTVIQLIDVR